MINVQYPFLDLTKALLTLIKSLKPNEWDKKTLFKDYKIGKLVKYLLAKHSSKLAPPADTLTLNDDGNDTLLDLDFVAESVEALENLLNSKADVIVDRTEYAESWLIQQYVRQALNNQDLLKREFYFPFLDEVMAQLAKHYQSKQASEGTIIKIEIVGEAGGFWIIENSKEGWQNSTTNSDTNATVYLDQQIAWLLSSDALHVNEIGQFYQIIGDKSLASHLLSIRIKLPTL